ncbi:IS66 family transposase [Tautonia plasticadhaerens]|uniref:Transposase IS66 family protein n=1 Tax=Tautonia plasticadhaerens TaxID=2527974 RepID=A0A518HF38_9BACT|nr:IS66 family transposase [Tautonia plasticadhaerens]QDV39463.1 Transposase IS66 family protein [Tautonia plasticadhaerens]
MSEVDAPLPDDLATCHELIRQQAATIREAQRRIEQLEHQVGQLLRRQYGPRSERLNPDQLRLFADDTAEEDAGSQPAEPVPEERGTPARTWRRRGRQSLPEHLPRERIVLELSEPERDCPDCGRIRMPFGEEVSEQLEFVPASLFVRQFVRLKYACGSCQEHVAIAAKPPQPIEKGLPGPGLLAQVITSKYGEHLPLYRQEDILARHGVTLSRATLCGWMARAAELLRPLYAVMIERVRASKVIWTDDTTVPVWDPTLPATRTGRFWVYLGGARNPFCVYDFTHRRTRDGPERFLSDFRGYLQADAFTGYDRICAGPDVIRVACWAHVRRKFYECRTTAPILAHEALARIRRLYRIETDCREMPAEERQAIRQRDAVPILAAFGAWLDEQSRQVLPKSPLGQAIAYARNQWPDLQTYTRDGELSIDNNLAERSLRAQAIGRKNYLFVGSDRGGRTAATLYSFAGSCKRLGADPFAYLREVLERLPTHPAARLAELLPDAWFAAHPDARRKAAS